MNDFREPDDRPAGDGELLSAYLDGELDEAAAAGLEARLEREPGLAARLEQTRDVIEALAVLRLSAPPGYAERLRERLAAERSGSPPEPAGEVAAPVAAAPGRPVRAWDRPPSGRHASTGPGRWAARGRWATPLTAAAAMLVVAVLGGLTVLGGFGGLGGQDAMVAGEVQDDGGADSAEPEARLFAEDTDDAAEEEAEDDGEAGDAGTMLESAPALADQPAIVEAGTELDSEQAAREHLSAWAATQAPGILGLDLRAAEDAAAAARVTIQRAAPFSTGVDPDRCLDTVTVGAEGPAVPVLVESLAFEDSAALAYLVVSATSGSGSLDRVEAWVVDPGGACAARLFIPVTP
jgi:hypothetical protein